MSETPSSAPRSVSQVVVKVDDDQYTMQCDAGEEAHLTELAQLIDTEVSKLKRNFGQVGDKRLLLMAGLVIADKLASALLRIEDLESEVQNSEASQKDETARSKDLEDAVAVRIEAAAERLEAMAREMSAAD